jgi:hypothetical protein
LDYRQLFSSKEWLLSFLEVFKPKRNFLIRLKNSKNYFSLSEIDNKLVFTGDPFNDFNSVFIGDFKDYYDFDNIINEFSNIGYEFRWTNLFEVYFLEKLIKYNGLQEGVIGLKIVFKNKYHNYDNLVSNRIRKMYQRFSKNLEFFRLFGSDLNKNPDILVNLLSTRRNKLLEKKKEEWNPSFEKKFDEFIMKVVSFHSIWNNVFIDYCVDKNDGTILASSFNFIKDKNTICYLRAHAYSENKVSYGLILDYWSNNKNFYNGIKVVDLTRGNESYKYRLGAIEYKLYNFVVI